MKCPVESVAHRGTDTLAKCGSFLLQHHCGLLRWGGFKALVCVFVLGDVLEV